MKAFLKIGVIMAALALPGLALATNVTSIDGSADCDGFQVTAFVHWGSSLTANLTYEARLVDEGGVEVATFNGAEVLNTTGVNTNSEHWYMGMWGMELCGTYTAHVTVTLVAPLGNTGAFETSSQAFAATFVCDCTTDACNFTPGYWKNHEENWPVTSLTLGGTTYTQAQLLAIMDCPVRGDATIILAYHLIAAKLNVLNGSDPSINSAIDQADALLVQYPLKSKPSGAARDMILDVKNQLVGYNELGCPGEDMGDDGDKDFGAETPSTWGELKANYR
ncbi:MAG: hypothetical protein R6X35_16325 [Candidatus Krumholzibacteriia bacterium]